MQLNPQQRGYMVLYHQGEPNRCPCCARSNWIVGRSMAECAFCYTALPMAEDCASEARPKPLPGSYAELGANSEWNRPVYVS